MLCFVDEEFNVSEEFLRFIHCKESLSGKEIALFILKFLNEDLTLNIQDCRGQGYDIARAVSGSINGLATRIARLNKKVVYNHFTAID